MNEPVVAVSDVVEMLAGLKVSTDSVPNLPSDDETPVEADSVVRFVFPTTSSVEEALNVVNLPPRWVVAPIGVSLIAPPLIANREPVI